MKPLKIKLILKGLYAVVRIIQIRQVINLLPPNYRRLDRNQKSTFVVSAEIYFNGLLLCSPFQRLVCGSERRRKVAEINTLLSITQVCTY